MINETIRIAITGPESTGKTLLTEQLAGLYGPSVLHIPEFARDYIANLRRRYTLEDIEYIAQQQIQLEENALKKHPYVLFCDTELTVAKIWAEFVFKQCPDSILQLLKSRHYHQILLCDIDLPWEYDPLREHPHRRQELMDLYVSDLSQRNIDFFIVKGIGEERFKNTVHFLENKFPLLSQIRKMAI